MLSLFLFLTFASAESPSLAEKINSQCSLKSLGLSPLEIESVHAGKKDLTRRAINRLVFPEIKTHSANDADREVAGRLQGRADASHAFYKKLECVLKQEAANPDENICANENPRFVPKDPDDVFSGRKLNATAGSTSDTSALTAAIALEQPCVRTPVSGGVKPTSCNAVTAIDADMNVTLLATLIVSHEGRMNKTLGFEDCARYEKLTHALLENTAQKTRELRKDAEAETRFTSPVKSGDGLR